MPHHRRRRPGLDLRRQAHRLADASLKRWLVASADGRSDLFPCDGPFAMHLVEALLVYADQTNRPEVRARVTAAGTALVASRRADEWFPKRWDHPAGKPLEGHVELLHQSAVARAAALVAPPPPRQPGQ